MTGTTVGAARRVEAAAPEAVFAFLADLENHWALAADWVEVQVLERVDGGPAAARRCDSAAGWRCAAPRARACSGPPPGGG